MTEVMNNVFNNIELFEKESYKNMTVIGLTIPNTDVDLMSLEIGLNMGLVEISEMDEHATVGSVKVVNKAVTPLLILDGEEIIGSLQNRIVNSTVIIPPRSEKIIPVTCVEEGRWHNKSSKFHYSNHMATSRVRKDKQDSVTKSLRNNNSFKSDQSRVWKNVSNTLECLSVDSSTSALHDSYTQRSSDLDDYANAFTLHENQNGLIVYINGELAGFEIIYNSARYHGYHEKLLKSYILDAITRKDDEYVKDESNEYDLIEKIRSISYESYDSVGLGVDYRVNDDTITGSVVMLDENLINASFFGKATMESD